MKIIQVKVKPHARESAFEELSEGVWLAKIKAPPVDGKANDALISLVADHFGLRRSQVRLKHGATGRMKLVQLE